MKLTHFYGQFHPALTHFPVALLLVAALAEAVAWYRPRAAWSDIAVFNLHLGAASAVVTATMGWALAATMGTEPDLRATLFWHRWLGTGTAAWAILAVGLWWWQRRRFTSRRLIAYRAALLGGALLVSVTGHLGGLLVYGLDYYSWPFK